MKHRWLVCIMILCMMLFSHASATAEEESGLHPDPGFVYNQIETSLTETGLEKIEDLDTLSFLNNTWVYVYLCRNAKVDPTQPSGYAVLYLAWAPESGVIPVDTQYYPVCHDGVWAMPDKEEIQTALFQKYCIPEL